MNMSGFTTINASTSQTIPSDTKPAQYKHGYHDGYASGLSFGITFAIDRVLEIIDEEQEEYRTAYEALANVYNRVMDLKGEHQS